MKIIECVIARQRKSKGMNMSLEACWVVKFGDLNQPIAMQNGGVIVLETNRVFGGDSFYAYLGNYEVDGDRVMGSLQVIRHDPTGQSVYGTNENQFQITFDVSRVDENQYRGAILRPGFPNGGLALHRLAPLP
jgi:hypothetical protein